MDTGERACLILILCDWKETWTGLAPLNIQHRIFPQRSAGLVYYFDGVSASWGYPTDTNHELDVVYTFRSRENVK
jgi:hypothetical protein